MTQGYFEDSVTMAANSALCCQAERARYCAAIVCATLPHERDARAYI